MDCRGALLVLCYRLLRLAKTGYNRFKLGLCSVFARCNNDFRVLGLAPRQSIIGYNIHAINIINY